MDGSDIFIFSARGEGSTRGSPKHQEGGGGSGFLLKIPGTEWRGGSPKRGGGGRGWEGVCGEFGGTGGGG